MQCRTEQYVSLKVGVADVSAIIAEREREALNRVRDKDPKHPGHDHIIHLLDSFHHQGPNGQHFCLVYKAMGENILKTQGRMPSHKIPLPMLKQITRQLLQALDLMHTCDLVHTGLFAVTRIIRGKICS